MDREKIILMINVFNVGICIPGLIGLKDWFFLFPIICSSLVIWAFKEYL